MLHQFALCAGPSTRCFALLLYLGLMSVRTALPLDLFLPNSVVAFVGGTDVVGMLDSGHLESRITAAFPDRHLRFRNFGWEGDTVYEQPRDYGFPPLLQHLQRARVTLVFLQFGRAEALAGPEKIHAFTSAYENLLNDLGTLKITLVLVIPPPYEDGNGVLPKLSRRNPDLQLYAEAIRKLALQRKLPCVDLFASQALSGERLTANGLQITPAGHARLAAAFARALQLPDLDGADQLLPDGTWDNPALEQLRQAVIAKNKLWFHYWRPQNWAFLGGDRTEQPSSRDHRNPEVRWFPEEMKEYPPMIESKEREIARLASALPGGAQ